MTALYSDVGEVLTHYEVDVQGATLTKRAAVTLPENVQYTWPHPSKRHLYVGLLVAFGAGLVAAPLASFAQHPKPRGRTCATQG